MSLVHRAAVLLIPLVASTLPIGQSNVEASISRVTAHDEAAIESIVRAHRPTAEETWIRTLTEAIYVESTAGGVDPLMIASIVASESSFQSRVVSHAGAVGLMQLRPFVARDVAERRAVAWSGVETLYAPDLNVRLGVLYYNELVERFDGDVRKALTAYNYGPSRVSRMIHAGTYKGSRYAETILERYQRLRRSRWS